MKTKLTITILALALITALLTACGVTPVIATEINHTINASVPAASGLSIGWTGSDVGTTISENVSHASLKAAIPVDLKIDETKSDVAFNISTVSIEDGKYIFNKSVAVDPYVFSHENASAFYLTNQSAQAIPSLRVTAEIPSDDPQLSGFSSIVRIGIFRRETAGSGDYLLKGVLATAAKEDAVAYGRIEEGRPTSDILFAPAVTEIDLGSLSANDSAANGADQADFVAVFWVDGEALTELMEFPAAPFTVNLLFSVAND